MKFFRPVPSQLRIEGVPALFLEMLRAIPQWNEFTGEAAAARLFPPPAEEDLPELIEDWQAHVRPGLQETFLSARQIVAADLAKIRERGRLASLDFPFDHADAWLNALNQARLSLAAIHGLSEEELARPLDPVIRTPQEAARLQMDFYAALQDWILGEITGDAPESFGE